MELLEKINSKALLAKIVSKKEIALGTHEFIFELEREMKFKPGQYIWVEVPHLYIPDLRGNRRAFSITNTPNDIRLVSIVFRSTKSGFNESLRVLNIGDEINMMGPFGDAFCLPEDHNTPVVLIAGGVGVAPFLSLIRYSAIVQSSRDIVLIVTNDVPEKIIYPEELQSYNDNTKSIKTISLTKVLESKDIENMVGAENTLFYVCGPQGFVDHAYNLFKARGVFDRQFHFEYFYPTTIIDQGLAQLFLNGKPRIGDTEPPYIQQRARLTYELVNATATHTVVTDIRGRILFANQAAQDITGFTLEEMLGNTPRLWGGLMAKEFYKKLWKAKLRGEIFNGEIINRRKNNEIYIASAHISPIKNENQEVIGFIGSEEDITSIRRAEQRALENEERFIQLTEKIPEVYWITDLVPTERVAYVSPAFEKIWGVSREALYRQPRVWLENIHVDDRKKVSDTFALFLENKSAFDLDYRVVRPDGTEVILNTQGELVIDKGNKIIRAVGVTRDITKEKTIDKEKTEFVSFASHQFKTPITAIRWNIESLLSGKYGELAAKQKEVLHGIYTMNTRIDELISNMLNVSRIEQGVFLIEPTPTDFVAICDEVLMEAVPYVEKKNHELTKEFQENLPKVLADQKLLRIIFQNYISNSIKYTHENGKVAVSLKVVNNDVVFSVSNNGDPIPEAEQSKIFQKMFRASNAPEQDPGGTGLGLYLVKQIVENGGGRVWFTSKKDGGTTFFASFPLTGMVRREGSKPLL